MNTEQAKATEQQTQARRRIEARRMAMTEAARTYALSQKRVERISDIGRAEYQSVSPEVLEVAHEEIAHLQRRINELEEQAESFKARIANQETVIRVQAETIARMEQEVHAFASRSATEFAAVAREDIVRSLQEEVAALRAEKWGEPVAVHTAPNVRRAGGE